MIEKEFSPAVYDRSNPNKTRSRAARFPGRLVRQGGLRPNGDLAINPRLGLIYRMYNNDDVIGPAFRQIQESYQGRVEADYDLMVIDIGGKVTVRFDVSRKFSKRWSRHPKKRPNTKALPLDPG